MSQIDQIQEDIDRLMIEIDKLINQTNLSEEELESFKEYIISNYLDVSDTQLLFNSIVERLGFDRDNSDKFNFAVITKIENDVEYQEYWIMSNAYYDYQDGYFHKMDMHNTSFGVQIQGKGAFPGEAELGYFDNSGINIWRNPSLENLDWATEEQKRCLVERGIIGEYDSQGNIKTFQVSCGWNNGFMFDSYGGMTIGGTGFEIDGNGIFPYTRVANCLYTNPNDNKEYGYIALLHNAYNSTRYGWDCDSNRTYSWLMGIHAPVDTSLGGNNLDLTQADFRVMYNDTPWNEDNTHELDITKWKTIFKVDLDSTEGMVDGVLTSLGDGYVHPSTKQCNYSYTHPTTKQCNYTVDLSSYVTQTMLNNAIDSITDETGSKYMLNSTAYNTFQKYDNLVTSWSSTTSNNKYPSEKLVKDSLNGKSDVGHIHNISDVTNLQSTLNGKAPTDHSSTSKTYGAGTSSKYGHVKLSDTSVSDWQSSATTITPSDADDSIGVSESALYDVYNEFSSQSKLTKNGHVHTTDEVRLAGTQYAITSMLNAMYSWYQQYSGQSPSWTGDSQNHVYVRDIIWDSTNQEYKITDDITDSIQPGTILILNVASTTANHYGGHDLNSFRNNGVSMWLMTNADMELSDYSTVVMIYNRGIASNTPIWIPILKDTSLCLNVDSSLVV